MWLILACPAWLFTPTPHHTHPLLPPLPLPFPTVPHVGIAPCLCHALDSFLFYFCDFVWTLQEFSFSVFSVFLLCICSCISFADPRIAPLITTALPQHTTHVPLPHLPTFGLPPPSPSLPLDPLPPPHLPACPWGGHAFTACCVGTGHLQEEPAETGHNLTYIVLCDLVFLAWHSFIAQSIWRGLCLLRLPSLCLCNVLPAQHINHRLQVLKNNQTLFLFSCWKASRQWPQQPSR